jgi:hypothetical protein
MSATRYRPTDHAAAAAPLAMRSLVQSWRRYLAAQNKAPRTIQTYTESLNRFTAFLAAQGLPQIPST